MRVTIDYNQRDLAQPKMTTSPEFCSQESLEALESPMATAPRADVWFLLEYSGAWGSKALKESDIPEAVKAHLDAALEAIPNARLLLIKQGRQSGESIAFFAALSAAAQPALYRFQLVGYEALLEMDLPALAAGDSAIDAALTEEPVFVNCTNGKRDQCCALYGVATYQALAAEYPELVWQSSHHGGHRFAANFIHLPYGLSYGRLRPDNAVQVLQAGLEKRIAMEHFRGPTAYDKPAQAAEILLRRDNGNAEIGAFALRSIDELETDRWQATFAEGELQHLVTFERHNTGRQVHLSCGDEKTGPVLEYKLLEHSVE